MHLMRCLTLSFLRSIFSPPAPKIIYFPNQSDAHHVLAFLKRPEIHLCVWYRNVYNRNKAKNFKFVCQNISTNFGGGGMKSGTGRQWQPTPALLPGKSHGWRSLVGCSPWGREELDTTEQPHFHLSLSCIGEGNGNPLQCSCLENPRDSGAWWTSIYGVAQSQTRLKWLSSSSVKSGNFHFILSF